MSLGEDAARAAVAVAVVLLPASMRERYSEQWRADLRDAEEAGVRRSQIAWGSLAFAATVTRIPIESGASRPVELVHKRERLASGLALGTALVSVTHFGSIVGFGWTVGFGPLGFLLAFSSILMTGYLSLAPIAAIVMVTVTRGVAPRVRWAVWLLVLASLAHLAQVVVDSGVAVENVYQTRGTAIYGFAVVMIVVATVILAKHFRSRESAPTKRPVAAVAGALVIGGGIVLGLANLIALHDLQRIVGSGYVAEIAATDAADGAELAAGLAVGERAAVVAIAIWVVAGLVGVTALVIVGFARGSTVLDAIARPAAVLCVLVVAHASVTTYMQLLSVGGASMFLPPDLLLMIGRWGLIAIALATIGGVRLRRSRASLPGVSASGV